MAEGSRDAFGKLFQKYWEKLYVSASRKLSDAELAKEVVHDIFLDLWRRRETIQITHLPAYLQKALHYRVINHLLARKDTFFFDVLENPGTSLYEADQQLLEKDLTALISSWVEALPEKRREIFVRHYFQHLTTKEIAEEMNISQKTVQNQLSLSLQFLRTNYGHLLPLLFLFQEISQKK